MPIRRRTTLKAAAAGGVAIATSYAAVREASAAETGGTDAFDTLRVRWRDQITGGSGVNPADTVQGARLAAIGTTARGYLATMTATGSALWPDLPLNASASITASYRRLYAMAYAAALPGTGDVSGLTAAVTAGLAYVQKNAYFAGAKFFGNWWDWQIGAPQLLLDTCVLAYGQIAAADLATYLAAVASFTPNATSQLGSSGQSTGANRVDICRSVVVHGILAKSADRIAAGRDGLSAVFPYVTSGDGFYRDASFVQHSVMAYTGTYGAVLLGGLARLFALLAGSTWAVTDPAHANIYAMAERAFTPVVFNGVMLDAVRGRAISRSGETNHSDGHTVASYLLTLAGSADTATAARLRSTVKGWLQRDYFSPYLASGVGVAEAVAAEGVLNDTSVITGTEQPGHVLFAAMDRAVHRRPGWLASLAMSSSRIAYYETGNGENLRGFHTGAGMLAVLGDKTLGQYTDDFWPTVDPYRLPGITVSRKTLPDAAGGIWGASKPTATWVGGVTDGTFAAAGQFLQGLSSTLRAKKSWFFLDDTIICLGANITASDGTTIESVVDNRNLGATGTHALTINGTTQPATLGWSAKIASARWAHLAGFGGYVFLGGATSGTTLQARREARSGSWHDINTGGSTDTVTRRYVTLWLDHGTKPSGASYAYQMMPFATLTQTSQRASVTGYVTVLANNDNQQGVTVTALGLTAINFWYAGTVGPVKTDQPAAVLIHEQNGQATITLSDPKRAASTVTLTWNRAVPAVLTKDPSVTVVATGSKLVLRFATAGTLGSSQKAIVRLG